jgi:hypothetical protein
MARIIKRSNIHQLSRRKLRYWLFRFRTEALQSVPTNGAPSGLKNHFERLPEFTDWKDFAVKWDVPEGDALEPVPLEIVQRKFSVWEEWQATMRAEVKVHPGFEKHEKILDEQ